MPSVAELIKALPEVEAMEREEKFTVPSPLEQMSLRPIPVGRWRRLGMLGTLQAKIAAAYLFYWLRSWFSHATESERNLAETHWRTALRMLDSMSYLRGAAMKVGQMMANFPDVAPREFVDTLDRLHFDAPPMHWSLLREMVHNELGSDVEQLFASFDHDAFAAASLGQVHRATLTSGEDVAVKIQYPGVGRAINDDLRNLMLFLLPSRLTRDWEYVKAQFEDIRSRLEMECDYQQEAANQIHIRNLYRESDGVVVPRVIPRVSTSRVLTMEYIGGVHLDRYLQGNPSQQQRNVVAERLVRAWYRMIYAGRTLYIDFHPGNVLFLDDGRIGLLDFGMMIPLDAKLWHLMEVMDKPLTTGRREDRDAANRLWCELSDQEYIGERKAIMDRFADWSWRPRYCGGEFDFGDEADFREGVDLFAQMVKRRYSRAQPCTPLIARQQFGWRSILYRLKAKLDIRPIAEEEVAITGWDRSYT
ncbi:MAG: AarF/ABC1/UbiB kinase family protein [Pirellulaceae bacterium]|nr:AarF/ABC1/UbiB kinase family protein [Planctomycetales bacterium]